MYINYLYYVINLAIVNVFGLIMRQGTRSLLLLTKTNLIEFTEISASIELDFFLHNLYENNLFRFGTTAYMLMKMMIRKIY